ncbi:hypothetical protein phiOC_p163 [Ochrobactrum phage vB_OspM_OC]|nr:hypothetical protein phiOC_p163 [Ochrobactrum phage vB_OspM_OC]
MRIATYKMLLDHLKVCLADAQKMKIDIETNAENTIEDGVYAEPVIGKKWPFRRKIIETSEREEWIKYFNQILRTDYRYIAIPMYWKKNGWHFMMDDINYHNISKAIKLYWEVSRDVISYLKNSITAIETLLEMYVSISDDEMIDIPDSTLEIIHMGFYQYDSFKRKN